MPEVMNAPSLPQPNADSQSHAETALSGRSPMSTLLGVAFLGTGSDVPSQIVTNEDLAPLGFDSEWIRQRSGILARRCLPPDEATSDMAIRAAERSLVSASVDRSEVDLVLVATMTPDHGTPSTACIVQDRMGLRCGAMDVNAACAGFMYALLTGAQFIKTGCCRRVLVIGADTNTRVVNPEDRKTFPLFGDGAGAVILGPGRSDQGLLSLTLGAEGEGGALLQIPAGGSRCPLTPALLARGQQFLQMDGRSVFKWAVRLIVDTIRDAVQHAQLTIDDLRLVILHQANSRILDAAASTLGLRREQLFTNLERYGNTSAGSIPLALDEACREGRIQRGDRILLCGFGAGLAWGTAVIQW